MSFGPYSAMRIAYGLVQGLVSLCDGGQGLASPSHQGQGLGRLTNPSPQYAMLVRYLIGEGCRIPYHHIYPLALALNFASISSFSYSPSHAPPSCSPLCVPPSHSPSTLPPLIHSPYLNTPPPSLPLPLPLSYSPGVSCHSGTTPPLPLSLTHLILTLPPPLSLYPTHSSPGVSCHSGTTPLPPQSLIQLIITSLPLHLSLPLSPSL